MFLKSTLICFFCGCIFILTSCTGTYQVPSSLTVNKSDSTSGVVLFSVSLPKQSYGQYYIDIFHIESRKKEKLFISTAEVPNFKNGEMKIFYGVKVLPKGEYKIYSWGIDFNDGTRKKPYISKANIAFPFTVFAGDVNYLGDYFGVYKRITNGGGLKVPTEAYFIVSNRYLEDKEIISKKFPGLNLNKTVDAMPDFTGNNTAHSGFYLKGINVP